jgi:hypothetical protein
MAVYAVDSTKAGTSLVAATGTISGITAAAAPVITDKDTQICLTDGPGGPILYAATLLGLVFLFEPRPGVALTPGTTAPVFPRSLGISKSYKNGVYVQSCPTGISLSVTAA